MLALYSLTLFVGAFLLFLVQPMVAKMVLPLLGGAPAVWNTCMVFFQAVLLAGYAYSHALPARLGIRRHAPLHAGLLLLPLATLPLRTAGWVAPVAENPVLWLLQMLAVTVGAPAFALATSAPLLQRWFAESAHTERRDPYFLYVASNLGSMAALIGYPLLIEPRLPLAAQSRLWTAGVGLWVALTALCAWRLARTRPAAPASTAEAATKDRAATPPQRESADDAAAPSRARRARWILLSLLPSSLMLGVTTYITTDIAPIPLMWVIPLALYLLSFIIVFARPPALLQRVAVALLPVAILSLVAIPIAGALIGIGERVGIHLAAFFVAALVCHGELAATRPSSRHLTAFYLWLSVGGVLGGVLNALIAPWLLPGLFEYPLLIAAIALLGPRVVNRTEAKARGSRAWPLFGAVSGLIFLLQAFGGSAGNTLLIHRNFFGVIRVKEDAERHLIGLQHGTTVHGIQSRERARRQEPLGYFSRPSPVGQVFAARDSAHPGENIGVVGLGAGTLACYARRGQAITFYEIDPAIERIARDTLYFTYVSDALARGARLRVVMGDARIQMARSSERYGLLVLDAFSSDVIPMHLLTRQAVHMYLAHLEPGGVLAFHVSSQYLRLEPALAALAVDAGLIAFIQRDAAADTAERSLGRAPSRWVVMARDEGALGDLVRDPRWRDPGAPMPRTWSDDFSSLAGLILWTGAAGAR